MGRFLLRAVTVLIAVQGADAGAVQGAPATVLGTVRDAETDGPLAGAVVALTGLGRAAATDADGRYVLRQVPAGPRHLTIHLIGYAHRSLVALVPLDGQLEINLALRAEPICIQPFEVRGPVVVRGAEGGGATAFPDRECSATALRNHPLLGEPDVFQVLGGGEVMLRPESPSGVHIRGGTSDQTAYLLDGIPVFNPYHTAGMSSAWNPDALSQLHLSSSLPSLSSSLALSGAIEAATRAPGPRASAQGSISTTQGRLTLDGPLGLAGAGYVLSLRTGLHDVIAPRDASYLKGQTADLIAKLEAPAFGGRIRLLGYDNDNDISTAVTAVVENQDAGRNIFEWHSQSFGAEWRRVFSSTAVRVLGWSAGGDASSAWAAAAAPVDMNAARRDAGLRAAFEHSSAGATTALEIRFQQSRTSYRIESDSTSVPTWTISTRTPVAAAVAQHAMALDRRTALKLGASLATTGRDLYAGPAVELRRKLSEQLTVSASYARTNQFAQSLRNPESVVGNVFPVDLYLGAGAPGVPVARSDQGVIAAEYRPRSGVRLGVQAYERASRGLLLVAPREGEPFATGNSFTAGSGTSHGVSADAAMSTRRCGIVASYGWQRMRLEYGESSYVPEQGASHLFEGGVTVFPSAGLSVRLGAAGALGRRTTTISGGFEWEASNLLDRGSEFSGSPHYGGESLGATALPAYFRVDLGVRKLWHLEVGRREASLALFGTATNILGRRNVLTYAREPSTGELVGIEMRPRSPLVVGLDWQF